MVSLPKLSPQWQGLKYFVCGGRIVYPRFHAKPLHTELIAPSASDLAEVVRWKPFPRILWSGDAEGWTWDLLHAHMNAGSDRQDFSKNTKVREGGKLSRLRARMSSHTVPFFKISIAVLFVATPVNQYFYQECAWSLLPQTISFKLFNLVSFMEDTLSRNVEALNILSVCQCFSRVLDEMVLVVLRSSLLGVGYFGCGRPAAVEEAEAI